MTTLSQRVAALVQTASDGEITAADALATDASLMGLGLGSLGFLRLVDAIEDEFGVELDLDEGFGALDRVDLITDRLRGLGVPAPAGESR